MVYIKQRAKNDLFRILTQLANWEKYPLTLEQAENYVDDITAECYSIEIKIYHADTQYETHRRFAKKVHTYKRNRDTSWYILYDFDADNNVIIKKIMSNHITIN